jgi:NAD(P)-dependent dehydrogenase (short-subunit alcohol dehydrogenase family)
VTTDLDGLGYRDTTAVVVGCSTGIGVETLRILGELGARVHAVGRHAPQLQHESFHATDLADLDAVAATAGALGGIGPIDHLLVCAGVPPVRSRAEVLRVNYVGVRHLVESALPALADGANICVAASNTAYGWEQRLPTLLELVAIADPQEALAWCDDHPEVSAEGFPAYILSKQALITWVTYRAPSLATERRIRLNCAAPGLTETPMVDEIAAAAGSRDLIEAYPAPLFGRITTAEEGAWPLVLLNSPLNAAVTGAVLFADQGVASGMAAGTISFL